MSKSLYHDLVEAGVNMDNHESDLYFEVTPISIDILAKYPDLKAITKPFTHAEFQSLWNETPFAYLPWWEKKQQITQGKPSFTPAQRQAVKDLLWDYLHKDNEHKDRRQTGWGTKTLEGLVKCVERIAFSEKELPHGN